MPYIPLTLYSNLPQTTVTSGGTTAPASGTQETWTVNSSAAFPSVEYGATQFHIADASSAWNSELITVSNVAGSTWTVTRGAEGTTPVAHLAGFTVVQVTSAGDLASLEYQPWQFPVQKYGAQGDGKIGSGGTGTSGTAVFTDAAASFVNATAPLGDVGKVIIINQGTSGTGTQAGTPQNPFCGTILTVSSPTSVTLSANLAATCTNAPYIYGTDDTAAINAAITAAKNFAVAYNYKSQVMFEPLNYMIGAAPTQTTSPYLYNTQIPVPFGAQYGQKVVIDLVGVGDASEPDYWETSVPSLQGTCLVSTQFATGQPNGTYGAQSVIGGPTGITGLGPGNFANALINVSGITVVCPWNSQQYGYDFRYLAQANLPNASYLAFAPVNLNYAVNLVGGPYLSYTNVVTNGQSVGLAMPLSTNNDNCNVGMFTVEGAAFGIVISEHFTAQRIGTFYCDRGVMVTWQPTGTSIHGSSILYWTCEACNTGLYTNASSSNLFPLFIGLMDTEFTNTTHISDNGYNLTGTCYWSDITVESPTVIGAARYNIVNLRQFPGVWTANAPLAVPAPPAAPASGTAQQNTAWRAATVYASASTSITSFAVGPSSGSLTSVTATVTTAVLPIRVPSGWWYSVTYSGTLTTTWFLD